MAEEAAPETTLRDTIEQAYETHVEAPATTPAPAASPSEAAPAPSEPATATSERPRDEQGRFVEKAAAKPAEAKAPAAAPLPAEAPPVLQPIPRPSSWGKEMWPVWEKLSKGEALSGQEARKLAEYNAKREGDYAKGVSTYKAEFDNAKPLVEALQPHMDSIKQMGIQPAQFVSNLANAHNALSRGSPDQKLSMLMKLAQDYQIPVQNLFVRGQDGQVYFNPQVQPYQAQPQQRPAPQAQDVAQLVREEVANFTSQQAIQQFAEARDAQGNPLRPHFETVKADMALLLDAGKAQDLEDAYRKALRMNDELWQAEQDAKTKADEAARVARQQQAVAAAKASNVSPKSATPAAKTTNGGAKGLRAQLEDAFDQHTASRV